MWKLPRRTWVGRLILPFVEGIKEVDAQDLSSVLAREIDDSEQVSLADHQLTGSLPKNTESSPDS